MSFENSAGLGVSNHYNARAIGGTDGSMVTSDARRIYVIDLDGDKPSEREIAVLNDGIVENVTFEGTAGDAAILIGAIEVTDAVYGTPVSFTAGNLTVTNTTGTGKVKVTVLLK